MHVSLDQSAALHPCKDLVLARLKMQVDSRWKFQTTCCGLNLTVTSSCSIICCASAVMSGIRSKKALYLILDIVDIDVKVFGSYLWWTSRRWVERKVLPYQSMCPEFIKTKYKEKVGSRKDDMMVQHFALLYMIMITAKFLHEEAHDFTQTVDTPFSDLWKLRRDLHK